MPEQLLAPLTAEAEHDDRGPEPGRQEAIDMTSVRALRESRTDVEALDLTADRLRRLQEVATKMTDDSRARADRHTAQADADVMRPDDHQAHHPHEPGPHRGREASH
ncbi:hypothetical protein [Streptomyces sp. NPDC018584]|uniref:hypothetical protein n=1 Tax=unclassified Streptomyces TaxID=2593676 RepID=UPI0037A76544